MYLNWPDLVSKWPHGILTLVRPCMHMRQHIAEPVKMINFLINMIKNFKFKHNINCTDYTASKRCWSRVSSIWSACSLVRMQSQDFQIKSWIGNIYIKCNILTKQCVTYSALWSSSSFQIKVSKWSRYILDPWNFLRHYNNSSKHSNFNKILHRKWTLSLLSLQIQTAGSCL